MASRQGQGQRTCALCEQHGSAACPPQCTLLKQARLSCSSGRPATHQQLALSKEAHALLGGVAQQVGGAHHLYKQQRTDSRSAAQGWQLGCTLEARWAASQLQANPNSKAGTGHSSLSNACIIRAAPAPPTSVGVGGRLGHLLHQHVSNGLQRTEGAQLLMSAAATLVCLTLCC